VYGATLGAIYAAVYLIRWVGAAVGVIHGQLSGKEGRWGGRQGDSCCVCVWWMLDFGGVVWAVYAVGFLLMCAVMMLR